MAAEGSAEEPLGLCWSGGATGFGSHGICATPRKESLACHSYILSAIDAAIVQSNQMR